MDKVVANAEAAIEGINSGMTLMIGGFGVCGIPENAIGALARTDVTDLTCISNNAGIVDFGLGILLKDRRIRKMIASYVGENDEFARRARRSGCSTANRIFSRRRSTPILR